MKKFLIVLNLMFLLSITACSANPIIPKSTPTPELNDINISAEIQNYYQNLSLKTDLSWMGMGIVDSPINRNVSISNIEVIDRAINDNQATIIARITFDIYDMPGEYGSKWNALSDYFGYDFPAKNFTQERKFIFQKYESGLWRLEEELER